MAFGYTDFMINARGNYGRPDKKLLRPCLSTEKVSSVFLWCFSWSRVVDPITF